MDEFIIKNGKIKKYIVKIQDCVDTLKNPVFKVWLFRDII